MHRTHRPTTILLTILFSVFLISCEQEAPTSTAVKPEPVVVEPSPTFDLMNEATTLHRFESTAEALTIWRDYRAERPTLLLLSNNPHMIPVPDDLQKKALILANNAPLENIQLAATDRNPSPLLLPGMAIDAAIKSGWFREVVWALPLRDPAANLDLEKFRSQLISAGVTDEQGANKINLEERILQGTLRNTPFRAAALPLFKNLEKPVIVHIDLSYYQPIYKNEIATPLLDIVHQTLLTLQKMHLETVAITFSYGHHDSKIALDVRFLGDILAWLIEDPMRLEQPIPTNWQRQKDALYLANFFQKEKIRELYLAQEKDAPDAGWVKFNLYRSAAEHKEGAKALEHLAQAVTLDSMYALEYLDLSNLAYERKRPDEALRMLELAEGTFHQDPFIKLRMAQVAHELGEKEKALELINKIRNLEWSKTYYPQMPQQLSELTRFIQSGEMSEEATGDKPPAGEESFELVIPGEAPSRQRIIHKQ